MLGSWTLACRVADLDPEIQIEEPGDGLVQLLSQGDPCFHCKICLDFPLRSTRRPEGVEFFVCDSYEVARELPALPNEILEPFSRQAIVLDRWDLALLPRGIPMGTFQEASNLAIHGQVKDVIEDERVEIRQGVEP